MGTKMAVAFANTFLAKIEKQILRQSSIKPIFWKKFIDDVISVWDTSRNKIEEFLLKAIPSHDQIHGWNLRNRNYIVGHDSVQRCQIQQGFYPWRANTLQSYRDLPIHEFLFLPPPGVTEGFIKGEALRTNSSENTFQENMRNFATRLKNRDCPATTVEKHLSEVIFTDRKKVLEQRNKNARKRILPFVTQYHPALPNLKNILMGKWHLIQNQPYLRNIFKEPPLILYRKGKSLKDTLVRAKL